MRESSRGTSDKTHGYSKRQCHEGGEGGVVSVELGIGVLNENKGKGRRRRA